MKCSPLFNKHDWRYERILLRFLRNFIILYVIVIIFSYIYPAAIKFIVHGEKNGCECKN